MGDLAVNRDSRTEAYHRHRAASRYSRTTHEGHRLNARSGRARADRCHRHREPVGAGDAWAHDGKGKSRAAICVDALTTRLGCTREGDRVDELVRHLPRGHVATAA